MKVLNIYPYDRSSSQVPNYSKGFEFDPIAPLDIEEHLNPRNSLSQSSTGTLFKLSSKSSSIGFFVLSFH
jgi:hypothetical protein